MIEDQVEVADQLRGNRIKVPRGRHREQHFFGPVIQAYLQRAGKLICFKYYATDTNLTEHCQTAYGWLTHCNGTQCDQGWKRKSGCHAQSLQILIADDVISCRCADRAADPITIGFEIVEGRVRGFLALGIAAKTCALEFAASGKHLAFQTKYTDHTGFAAGNGIDRSVSVFSGLFYCAECGGLYGSKLWHSNDRYRRVMWRCNHKYDNTRQCRTPSFTEDELKVAFLSAFNKILTERNEIKANFELVKEQLYGLTELEAELTEIQAEEAVAAELINQCIRENARVALNQDE